MKKLKDDAILKPQSDDTELLAIIIYVIVGFLLFYYGAWYVINFIF